MSDKRPAETQALPFTIAGFLLLCMVGAFTGYVQTLCMHADWRGHGLGTRLLQATFTRAEGAT
jgi:GNAT superfamily N-acetyltransferase